jgi:hypothetical protein
MTSLSRTAIAALKAIDSATAQRPASAYGYPITYAGVAGASWQMVNKLHHAELIEWDREAGSWLLTNAGRDTLGAVTVKP